MQLNQQDEPNPSRVLVVEDEARLRDMLLDAIPEMGFTAVGAASAEAALRYLEKHPCDIVILDLNLPGMNGMDLFNRMRSQWPSLHAIVLTGYGTLEAAQRAIQLEVVEFLTKPASLAEIEHALSRAQARMRREEYSSLMLAQALQDKLVRPQGTPQSLEAIEREHILGALDRHHGNRAATARELGISVRALYYKISAYQLQGYL